MKLSPIIRILVAIATAAPLLAFVVPGAFMGLVTLGLWDKIAAILDPQAIEAVGWSGLFILGSVLAVNHLCLTFFYLWHITSSHSLSTPLRLALAAAVLIVPLVAMPVYCLLHVVPIPVQAVSPDLRDA